MRKVEPRFAEIIDEAALSAEIRAIASEGTPTEFRPRLLARLKEIRRDALARAERLLEEDGSGTMCARRLAHLQDFMIRELTTVAVERVYRAHNPSMGERIAILAVGGYGRGTLAPGSDVDLLFVLPYKQTAWTESVIEFVLYALWDLRLKVGHATRTIDECIRLARSDMTIRTALLESRFLWGEEAFAETLRTRFLDEVVRGTAAEFIAAKLAERDERHRRQGRSRYLVEPNVKEGKGGLRDLHTLFWIAKYFYRVRRSAELVDKGVFSRAEYNAFRKAEDFLWAVRCHLHFLTGKAEERLSFDVQREIAVRLGYTSHPGMKDVERFMKHYFLVAKDVGDLTRIFCAALEEEQVKATPGLNRFLRSMRRRRKSLGDNGAFVVEHDRINVVDEAVFARDPVNLIRIFHLADKHSVAFHPDAMRLMRRSLALIDQRLRDDPEANRLFIEILTSRKEPEIVLRLMSEAGVLGRFVPDFGRIVAMMQFNMYHHYTVDEHLVRSIGILSEIDRGELVEDHPVATRLMASIQNRKILYVALFLHDIAKGRPEDHSIAGTRIARRLCPRFGFTPAETEAVAWLVEHHLVMSMTAQSRDLSDPKTIEDFARIVESPERLKMLHVLTVADIKAVGPGVWNGWKAQLLRTLFYETEPLIAGGHSRLSREQRVEAARRELAAALGDWTDAERDAYLNRHFPAYWMRVDLDRKLEHAALVRRADASGHRLATTFAVRPERDVTTVTVLAPDHPRVLSVIAGACTVAGANIVDAQIFTTTDGLVLDSISIKREFPEEADELRRASRVCRMIERVIGGEERLPERMDAVGRKIAGTPPKTFHLEPEVMIDNAASGRFTMIEVSGLDRPGFLYDLTRAISDLSLNIASAHVATFGERARDVFYVTDLMNHKITNASRQAAIRRRLIAVLDERARPAEPARPRERRPQVVA
jgi:[protein-PII] uridylyltransferase